MVQPIDRARKASGEDGFTLVLFVMIIAVMSIMMGVAVQSVAFQQQREKESELIFRGGQYVEAIRLYKARYGRNPMRMKEIWEADPKVIRQAWKDPITGSENWGIIFVGQEGQTGSGQGRGGGGSGSQPTGTPTFEMDRRRGQGNNNSGLPPGVQRNEEGELMGPITGVHSTSCEQSIRIYENRTTYCEWRFIFKDDQQRGRGGRGGGRQPVQDPNRDPSGRDATNPRGGGYHAGDDPRDRGRDDYKTPPPGYTPRPRRTGTPTQ